MIAGQPLLDNPRTVGLYHFTDAHGTEQRPATRHAFRSRLYATSPKPVYGLPELVGLQAIHR
jgi:hypothetical protein